MNSKARRSSDLASPRRKPGNERPNSVRKGSNQRSLNTDQGERHAAKPSCRRRHHPRAVRVLRQPGGGYPPARRRGHALVEHRACWAGAARTAQPHRLPSTSLAALRPTDQGGSPMTRRTQTVGATNQGSQVVSAVASTDCPSCGGFTALSGSGRQGERVQLTGTCPDGHSVFFNHTVQ